MDDGRASKTRRSVVVRQQVQPELGATAAAIQRIATKFRAFLSDLSPGFEPTATEVCYCIDALDREEHGTSCDEPLICNHCHTANAYFNKVPLVSPVSRIRATTRSRPTIHRGPGHSYADILSRTASSLRRDFGSGLFREALRLAWRAPHELLRHQQDRC